MRAAGDRYDGEFKDGQEDGIGIFTWADGSTYNGFWQGGLKAGVGVYRPASTENKRATTPSERHATQPAASELVKAAHDGDREGDAPSPREAQVEGVQPLLQGLFCSHAGRRAMRQLLLSFESCPDKR